MNQKPIPGRASTIDEVLAQLVDIIDLSIKDDNYIFAFTKIYHDTTVGVKKAIEDGKFEDNERMERLDVVFANLFIKSYYDFRDGNQISKSWTFAYSQGNQRLSLVQYILFGMNAHINFDLAIAAAQVAPGIGIVGFKNDFMKINDILASLTNSMQKSLGKASPLLMLLDFFGFKKDEKIINFSIKKARDFSWSNALELALMNESSSKKRISEIDNRIVFLSQRIKNPPGILLDFILKFIALFEVRNQHKILVKLEIE